MEIKPKLQTRLEFVIYSSVEARQVYEILFNLSVSNMECFDRKVLMIESYCQ